MDFLLLLPSGVRVVIYDEWYEGKPSPQINPQRMAARKSLRLLEYAVYRFGAHEHFQLDAEDIIINFYPAFF